MAPDQERCPICDARRTGSVPRRVNPLSLALALLALAALAVAALLLQRQPDLVSSVLPLPTQTASPSATPNSTPRPTRTPSPTPSPTLSVTPSVTATATDTVTPSPTPAYELYVVASGDSAPSIARRHGITEQELRQINGLTPNTQLVVGQELVVPALPETPTLTLSPTATPGIGRVEHIVAEDETLLRIAALYDVTVEQILRANDLDADAILSIGQRLIIEDAALDATAQPTQPRPTATPTEVLPITHTVAAGEHLGILALLYDVSAEEIARANGITTESILSIGQELTIPRTVATPDYSPTPSAVPSETPTPTPTLTPTPLPTATIDLPPTATPLAVRDYGQPLLLAPPDTASYTEQDTPLLNWTSVGILDEDEWYLVRLWYGPEFTRVTSQMTRTASWRLPPELYPGPEGCAQFMWQVVVVRQRYRSQRYDAVSPESALRRFTWR